MTRLRVGDLLLLHERIAPWALEKAFVDARMAGQRIISFLVASAQLEADDGTQILAEQLCVPAAYQRHLDRRDPTVIRLIPAELARRHVVFPIAISADGSLVVVARDPSNELAVVLSHVVRAPVVLAVAPALFIERAVLASYGELEVDTGELVEVDGTDTPPTSAVHAEFARFDLDEDTPTPRPRRAKSISDFIGTVGAIEVAAEGKQHRAGTERTIELALDEIDRALSRAAAERHLMAYLGRFWKTALLLRVDGDHAVAFREHGVEHRPLDAIRLSLGWPSTIQVAHSTQVATTERPLGQIQDRLATLLGTISGAAPLMVGGQVEAIVVVGTPLEPGHNVTVELDQLADAMGAAYTRHRAP